MEVAVVLKRLSESRGVSGFEVKTVEIVKEMLAPFVDEVSVDRVGNLVALKRGHGVVAGKDKSCLNGVRPSVFLAAHLDEIGLMVTKVDERGFIYFTTVGGFDPRTLPGQLVTVHGKKDFAGVVGTTPPHLLTEKERNKEAKTEDMFIDICTDKESLEGMVRTGDLISVSRKFITMKDKRYLSGKAMDNRVGAAVLVDAAERLQNKEHYADVLFVGTVQEEVGTRGAVTSCYQAAPQVGIALDVCHGDMPGVGEEDTFVLGKGVAIAVGPNIHPLISLTLQIQAKKGRIPFRLDPTPGATPTDARSLQVTREGIPTGLLSVPLRYMHTAVEMVHAADVRYCGRLLAGTVTAMDEDFFEKLRVFD